MLPNWLRLLFRSTPSHPPAAPPAQQDLPELRWIDADKNPWGVRILDVTPITREVVSTSQDPQMAANAASFSNEDGLIFVGQPLVSCRSIDADLRYRVDGGIYDGVLFNPAQMEHKWALYFHGGRVICVRSWTRQVRLVADTRLEGDSIVIHQIHGAVFADHEPAPFTIRALDFLIASHSMQLLWPAPLPPGAPAGDREAALWVMSCFGSLAPGAMRDEPVTLPRKRPLRTDSLLHIAVARGQVDEIRRLVAVGYPVDLRSRTGQTPLHWATQSGGTEAAALLRELGADPSIPDPADAQPE